VRVEAQAVLELEARRAAVRVAERERGRGGRAAAQAGAQLPRERRRAPGREVRQRLVAERAEPVDRLVLREAVAAQLGGELEAVLVVEREPGELVHRAQVVGALPGGERRAAAERQEPHPAARRPAARGA
jgi:hypothetical protein